MNILETHSGEMPADWPGLQIAPLIQESQDAFAKALPELLQTHYRKWVAFSCNKQLGISDSGNELYQRLIAEGHNVNQFVVRCIVPDASWDDGDDDSDLKSI